VRNAECARSLIQSITILYVPNATIIAKTPQLDELWGAAVAVPGTHGVHCVRTLGLGQVMVAKYSEQAGVYHSLLPVRAIPAAEAAHAADPVNVEPVHTAELVCVAEPVCVADGVDSDQDMVTVTGGRWYGVYWEPTSYWYIGQAMHQTDTNTWLFSFLEQTHPGNNRFKPVKDTEPVDRDFVFVEVEAPAPVSSTRTSLLKLTTADFRAVLQKFRDL